MIWLIILSQSRDIDRKQHGKVKEANMYYFIEAAIALFVSFLINVFVMSVFAHGLFDKSNADVVSFRNTALISSTDCVYTITYPFHLLVRDLWKQQFYTRNRRVCGTYTCISCKLRLFRIMQFKINQYSRKTTLPSKPTCTKAVYSSAVAMASQLW